METDLRARLLADAGLIALVADRTDWIERPSAVLPSITLQLVSPGRGYTHDGASGLQGSRVQIDCWGSSFGQARAVAKAAIAAVEPPATVGGTTFEGGFVDGESDFGPEDLDGGVRVYRRSFDVILWWQPV